METQPVKVYVSGQITGLPEDVFLQNFEEATLLLQRHGFSPVNPAEVTPGCEEKCESDKTFSNGNYQHTWQCYMKYDIMELLECDAIFAMENAVRSKGAMMEIQIAMALGMKVITSSNGEDLDW